MGPDASVRYKPQTQSGTHLTQATISSAYCPLEGDISLLRLVPSDFALFYPHAIKEHYQN